MTGREPNTGSKSNPTTGDLLLMLDDIQHQETDGLIDELIRGNHSAGDVAVSDFVLAEREVAFYVRHGMVESLLRANLPPLTAPLGEKDRLRALKDVLIGIDAVCRMAAIEGGVATRIVYGPSNEMIRRIEACTTEEELAVLADEKIIPLRYCFLVHVLTHPQVSDADVTKAISFIHDHHHDKIVVSDVAQHVGLSPEHLSAKFKRETGRTITDYLIETRVEEAKVLLRFSKLTVAEVAAQLSYSQSHFQTVFKRVTGMTPQQYRTMSHE